MGMVLFIKRLTVRQLAGYLKAKEIPVDSIYQTSDPECEDDAINITADVSIQVPSMNDGPVSVGRYFVGSMFHWPDRTDLVSLVDDIKMALAPDWQKQWGDLYLKKKAKRGK